MKIRDVQVWENGQTKMYGEGDVLIDDGRYEDLVGMVVKNSDPQTQYYFNKVGKITEITFEQFAAGDLEQLRKLL